MISWEHFSPVTAVAGGGLIGLSAATLGLFNGRIAGISGILNGFLSSAGRERRWRAAFLTGMLLGPVLAVFLFSEKTAQINAPWWAVVVGGLLVGFGTRYGSGCTSGHGVCGVARGSRRSMAAVGVFMLAAMLTVALTHLGG